MTARRWRSAPKKTRAASRTTPNSWFEQLSERLGRVDAVVVGQAAPWSIGWPRKPMRRLRTIAEQAQRFDATIGQRLGALEQTLQVHGGALVDRIAVEAEQLATRIGDNSRHFAEEFDARIDAVDKVIGEKGVTLVEEIDAKTGRRASALPTRPRS